MYARDDVELLLPAVWHESYWTNPPRKKVKASVDPTRYRAIEEISESRLKNACYPDDRKGFSNPKHSNTVWVELIDAKRAWEKTELTLKERRAVLMAFGLRWEHQEIAEHEECDRSTISHRIANAIDKMTAFLNGTETEEEAA